MDKIVEYYDNCILKPIANLFIKSLSFIAPILYNAYILRNTFAM